MSTLTLLTSDSSLVLCWDKSWLVHSFGYQVSVASQLIVGSLLINYKIGDQWSQGLIQFLLVHKTNENNRQPVSCCVPFENKLLIMPSLNGKYCLKPLENIVKLNLKLNNFWCVKCKPKVCCQYTNFPLSSISRNWHFMSQFLWH